jgi:two-component system CheB/CheR fusion protein
LLLAEARDYAESIVETMRESLVVLDGDLRVRSANRAFQDQFKLPSGEILGRRLDAIGPSPWNVPELTRLLEKLAGGSEQVDDVQCEHELPGLGTQTLVVSGRRMAKTGWIVLTLANVTDSRQMEARLASRTT